MNLFVLICEPVCDSVPLEADKSELFVLSVLGMTLNCIHPYCLVCAPNGERLGPPLITVVASARACGVKMCSNKIHAGMRQEKVAQVAGLLKSGPRY